MSRTTKKRAFNKISRAVRRFTSRNLRRVGLWRTPVARRAVTVVAPPQQLFARNALASSVWAVAGVATLGALSFSPSASAVSDCDPINNTVNPGDPYSTSSSVGSLVFDVCDIVDDLTIVVNDTHVVSADGDDGSDFAAIEVVAWNDRDADHDSAANGFDDGASVFTGVDFGEASGNVTIDISADGQVSAFEAFGIHVIAEGDIAEAASNDSIGVSHTLHSHTLYANQAATDGDIAITLDGLVSVDAVHDIDSSTWLGGVYANAQRDIEFAFDKNVGGEDDDDDNTGEVSVRGGGDVEVSWESLGGEDGVTARGIAAYGDETVNVGGVEAESSTLTVDVDLYGATVDVYAAGVRAESDFGDVYVDNISVVADATGDETGTVQALGVLAHAEAATRTAELKDATVSAIVRGDEVGLVDALAADMSAEYVAVVDSALSASAHLVADSGSYAVNVYGLYVDDDAESVDELTVSGTEDAYTSISAAAGVNVGNAVNSLTAEVDVTAVGVYAEVDDAINMSFTNVSVMVGQVDAETGVPLYDDEDELLPAIVAVSEGVTPSRLSDIDINASGLDLDLETDAVIDLDYVNVDVDIAAKATGGSPAGLSDVRVYAYGIYAEFDDDGTLTLDDSDVAVNVVVATDDISFVEATGIYVEHGGAYVEMLLEDTDITVTASMSLLADVAGESLAGTADELDGTVFGFEAQESDWSDRIHLDGVGIDVALNQTFDGALAGDADADVVGLDAQTDSITMRDTEITASHRVDGATAARDIEQGDDISSNAFVTAVQLEADYVDLEGVQALARGEVDLGGSEVSANIYAETVAVGIDLVSWAGEEAVSLADVQGYAEIDAKGTAVAEAGEDGSVRFDLYAYGIDITDDGVADAFLIDEHSVGAAKIAAVAEADIAVEVIADATGLRIDGAGVRASSIDLTDVTGLASVYVESDAADYNFVGVDASGMYVEAITMELDRVDARGYAKVTVDGDSTGKDADALVFVDVVGLYAEAYGDMTIEQSQFAAEAVVSVENIEKYVAESDSPVNVHVNALDLTLNAVDADASLSGLEVTVDAALSIDDISMELMGDFSKYGMYYGMDLADADIVGIDFSVDFNGDSDLEVAGRVDFDDVVVSSESVTLAASGALGGGLFGSGEDSVSLELTQWADINESELLDLDVAGIEVRGDLVVDDSGLSPEYDALDVGMSDVEVDFADVSATVMGGSVAYFVGGEDIVGNALASADVVGINIGSESAAGQLNNGFYAEIGDVALDNVRVYLDDVTVAVGGSQVLVLEGEDSPGTKYVGQNHLVSGDVWGIAIDSNHGDIRLDDVTVATEVTGYAAGFSVVQVQADNATVASQGNDIVSVDSVGINLIGEQEITLSYGDVTVTGNAELSGVALSGAGGTDGFVAYHFDNDGIDLELTGVEIDGDDSATLGSVEQTSVSLFANAHANGYAVVGIGEDIALPFFGNNDAVDNDGEVIEVSLDGVRLYSVDEAQMSGVDITLVSDASLQPKYEGGEVVELFGYGEAAEIPLVAITGDDVLEVQAEGLYVEADVIDISGLTVDVTVTNLVGSADDELAAASAAGSLDDIFDVNIDGVDIESYSEGAVSLVDFDITVSESNTLKAALAYAENDLVDSDATGLELDHGGGSLTTVKDIASNGIARGDDEWSIDLLNHHQLTAVAGEYFGGGALFGFIGSAGGVRAQDDLVDAVAEGIDASADGLFVLGGADAGEFVAVRNVIDVDAYGEMSTTFGDGFELSAYAVDINAGEITVNQLTVENTIDVYTNGDIDADGEMVYAESRALDLNAEVITLTDVALLNQLKVNIEGYASAGSEVVYAEMVDSTIDGNSVTLTRVESRVVVDIDINAADLGADDSAVTAGNDLVELENVFALDVGNGGDELVASELYVALDVDVDVTGSAYADADTIFMSSDEIAAAVFYSNDSIDLDDVTAKVDMNLNTGAYVEAHDEEIDVNSVRALDFNANELDLETFDVDMTIDASADSVYAEVFVTAVGIGADDVSDSVKISGGSVDIHLTGYANAADAGEGDDAVYLEATGVWSSATYTSMHDVDIDVELHGSAYDSMGYVETWAYGAWISGADLASVSVGADNAIAVKATSVGGMNEAYAEALTITADHLLNNEDAVSLSIAGTVSAAAYAEGGTADANAISITTYGGGEQGLGGLEANDLVIANSGTISAYAEGDSVFARALYVDVIQGEDYASQEVVIDNLDGGIISATVGAVDGYGTAIEVVSDEAVTITNDGTITGRILTGSGDDLLTNNSANTWNAFGVSDFGDGDDVINNTATGRIVMTNATIDLGTFDDAGVYTDGNEFTNAGLIEVVGDNTIDMGEGYSESSVSNPNALVNSGHIDFTDSDGSTDDSLMVYGDFYSDGGELTVDIDGGAELSDMLSISGDLTGTTVVNAILHSVPHGQESFAVQVVNVEGDQTGDIEVGDVTIADDHLFDWDINRSWNLDSGDDNDGWLSLSIESLSDAGVTLTSIAPALQSMWQQSIGTLAQREGVNRHQDGNVGLWVRGFNSSGDLDVDNSYDTRASIAMDVDGSEVGIDFALGDKVKVGLFAGTSNGDFDLNHGSGAGQIDGDMIGAFVQLRTGGLLVDFSYREMDVDGDVRSGVVSQEVKGDISGYNLELAYTFQLDSGLRIEPQLQSTSGKISLDNLADVATTYGYFTQVDADSHNTRFGVMLSRDYVDGDNTWTPHLALSTIDQADGSNDYEINGLAGTADTSGNSLLLEAGISGKVGNAVFFGGVNYLDGGVNDAQVAGQLGIKYRF
ncbi:autotransporter domain-containing protein [Gammaproteobacteria bacterium LSUCC0057]|uniref:Autotransporter domain-containing protein n=1 Tax=Gammaproteobacteria bacterium LSUCC0057 TaxID=2559237 RepID=A0A4Y8UGA3_9GAMM|nr:autotransporter domain-containing protein [Gammaproteobacteria bacterium LSUCC0057]